MRYLILSDIHANREALETVLRDVDGAYDEILCLGDLIGYGADPNAVVDWARENVKSTVRGNHDKVALHPEDMEWFNPVARQGAVWTRETLTEESLAYIESMSKGPLVIQDFQLVHGSPLDEDEYVVSHAEAGQLWGYLDTPLTFFGHTHVQGGFRLHRNGVRRIEGVAEAESGYDLPLEEEYFHLINPGSVGQPRDGDPRAAYALYTPEAKLITYRRVAYDIEGAQKKIIDAGLPPVLAERLAIGC